MKEKLYALLGIAFVAWCFYVFWHQVPTRSITVAGKTLQVEVEGTNASRELGLSGRESLPAGHGMLFVFDTPGNYGFWMKDMRFPLDIVWLDNGFHIVDIARNLSPNSFPQVFYPPVPVKYVLETNPGEL